MKNKPIVLIVEDEERIAEKFAKIVEEEGYKALIALNGIEALKLLDQHERGLGFLTNKIACVLLDWQMPKMNGEQFLKILRRKERWHVFRRYIPVVIVSAYAEAERWKYATNPSFGMAAGYLIKPVINPEPIKDLLRRIIIEKDNETLIELTIEERNRRIDQALKDQKQD